MGLISKLKPRTRSPQAEPSLASDLERVREARTLARRRLIGAALLLMVGIIGFPLLFESQPRPIPVDIPITIPSRDAQQPLMSPNARASRADPALQPPPVEAPPGEASNALPSTASSEPAASSLIKSESLPASVEPPKLSETKASVPKTGVAKALEPKPLEPKPTEAKPVESPPAPPERLPPSSNGESRFVVQVGAYTEAAGVRDARAKVEALGFKTYTQVVESSTGRRIRVRVGPFGSKPEADAAAARIKASGLPTALLQL